MLDVIEHLSKPEDFVRALSEKLSGNHKVEVLVSSGNVCFFVTRLMMLFGQFNYGRRGILDMTHTRLFNRQSLIRLFRYAAYDINAEKPIPAPYPLALGLNKVTRLLLLANRLLAMVLPGLFAYQIFLIVKPKENLDNLLKLALESRNDA